MLCFLLASDNLNSVIIILILCIAIAIVIAIIIIINFPQTFILSGQFSPFCFLHLSKQKIKSCLRIRQDATTNFHFYSPFQFVCIAIIRQPKGVSNIIEHPDLLSMFERQSLGFCFTTSFTRDFVPLSV